MAFFLNLDQLKAKPSLNDSKFNFDCNIFIENEELLIKALEEELQDIIRYLTTIPSHEHIIKPIEYGYITYPPRKLDKLDYKSAYFMKYLKNAQTFKSLYAKNISYEEKIKYSQQLFSALRFLHQYIVVGDIHSTNLLVNDGNAYISDLENGRKASDKFKTLNCLYDVSTIKNPGNSKYTDIVKLYLECLSLILEIPLANFIIRQDDEEQRSYKCFYKVITSYQLPREVYEFLRISLSAKRIKKLGDEAYNFERFINPEVQELKRKLNFFNYY